MKSFTITFRSEIVITVMKALLLLPLLPVIVGAESQIERVINGHPSSAGQFSWIVSLSTSNFTPAQGHFCAGVLISERYVLTAAHCVEDLVKQPYTLVASIGRTTLTSEDGIQRSIRKIIVHPLFSYETLIHDVALVQLSKPVTTVPVLRLAGMEDQSYWDEGSMATVLGWGVTDPIYSIRPDNLQQGEIPVISEAVCAERLGLNFDPESMLCAGVLASEAEANDGVDACFGDSGGPLVGLTPDGWLALGTVSWGYTCGGDRFWGVYSKIAASKDWILTILDRVPFNITPPKIKGKPIVGAELKCAPGGWGGAAKLIYAYRWRLNGKAISGAKSKYYQVRSSDRGKGIVCKVTARNSDGQTIEKSNSLGPIK